MILDKRKLQLARIRSGKSIRQIAKETGCSTATVQKAINGGSIQPLNAGKIAAAMNVDILEIIPDNDELFT